MPRTARQQSTTGTYHVLLLPAKKRGIFRSQEDYQAFLDIVHYVQYHRHQQVVDTPCFQLTAYTLLPKHVHMLIREGEEAIADIVRRITVQYAAYYNERYNTYGRVFHDRFQSVPCDSEAAVRDTTAYIHANALKHRQAIRIADYPWSSAAGQDIVIEQVPQIALTEDRRVMMTDYKVLKHLLRLTRTTSLEEFLALDRAMTRSAIAILRQKGASLGQLVRVTGYTINIIRKAHQTIKLPIRTRPKQEA